MPITIQFDPVHFNDSVFKDIVRPTDSVDEQNLEQLTNRFYELVFGGNPLEISERTKMLYGRLLDKDANVTELEENQKLVLPKRDSDSIKRENPVRLKAMVTKLSEVYEKRKENPTLDTTAKMIAIMKVGKTSTPVIDKLYEDIMQIGPKSQELVRGLVKHYKSNIRYGEDDTDFSLKDHQEVTAEHYERLRKRISPDKEQIEIPRDFWEKLQKKKTSDQETKTSRLRVYIRMNSGATALGDKTKRTCGSIAECTMKPAVFLKDHRVSKKYVLRAGDEMIQKAIEAAKDKKEPYEPLETQCKKNDREVYGAFHEVYETMNRNLDSGYDSNKEIYYGTCNYLCRLEESHDGRHKCVGVLEDDGKKLFDDYGVIITSFWGQSIVDEQKKIIALNELVLDTKITGNGITIKMNLSEENHEKAIEQNGVEYLNKGKYKITPNGQVVVFSGLKAFTGKESEVSSDNCLVQGQFEVNGITYAFLTRTQSPVPAGAEDPKKCYALNQNITEGLNVLTDGLLEGTGFTMFGYGFSGTGKSYTLFGSPNTTVFERIKMLFDDYVKTCEKMGIKSPLGFTPQVAADFLKARLVSKEGIPVFLFTDRNEKGIPKVLEDEGLLKKLTADTIVDLADGNNTWYRGSFNLDQILAATQKEDGKGIGLEKKNADGTTKEKVVLEFDTEFHEIYAKGQEKSADMQRIMIVANFLHVFLIRDISTQLKEKANNEGQMEQLVRELNLTQGYTSLLRTFEPSARTQTNTGYIDPFLNDIPTTLKQKAFKHYLHLISSQDDHYWIASTPSPAFPSVHDRTPLDRENKTHESSYILWKNMIQEKPDEVLRGTTEKMKGVQDAVEKFNDMKYSLEAILHNLTIISANLQQTSFAEANGSLKTLLDAIFELIKKNDQKKAEYENIFKIPEANSNPVLGFVQLCVSDIIEKNKTLRVVSILDLYGKGDLNAGDQIAVKPQIISYEMGQTTRGDKEKIPSSLGTIPDTVSVSADLQRVLREGFKKKGDLRFFYTLMETIEKVRIENQKIKPTPNNMKSSRAHLVMTFCVDDKTYFSIIDMAGIENPYDIAEKTGVFSGPEVALALDEKKKRLLTGGSKKQLFESNQLPLGPSQPVSVKVDFTRKINEKIKELDEEKTKIAGYSNRTKRFILQQMAHAYEAFRGIKKDTAFDKTYKVIVKFFLILLLEYFLLEAWAATTPEKEIDYKILHKMDFVESPTCTHYKITENSEPPTSLSSQGSNTITFPFNSEDFKGNLSSGQIIKPPFPPSTLPYTCSPGPFTPEAGTEVVSKLDLTSQESLRQNLEDRIDALRALLLQPPPPTFSSLTSDAFKEIRDRYFFRSIFKEFSNGDGKQIDLLYLRMLGYKIVDPPDSANTWKMAVQPPFDDEAPFKSFFEDQNFMPGKDPSLDDSASPLEKLLYYYKLHGILFSHDNFNFESKISSDTKAYFETASEKLATIISTIIEEGFFINETIRHIIAFFQKTLHNGVDPEENIVGNKLNDYFVSGGTVIHNDRTLVEVKGEYGESPQVMMIPILKYLKSLNDKTKFVMLCLVRPEIKPQYCEGARRGMEFGQEVALTAEATPVPTPPPPPRGGVRPRLSQRLRKRQRRTITKKKSFPLIK